MRSGPELVSLAAGSFFFPEITGLQEGGPAAPGGGEEGGPAAEDTSEEALLQRALAMSMDGGAPDLAAMTEEEQIADAMRMSMADSQGEASQVRAVLVHHVSMCHSLSANSVSLS